MASSSIKVVAFDLFGTVFDPMSVEERERELYAHALGHWRKHRQYLPVHPNSIPSFTRMQPYDDSRQGIDWLREAGFTVIAASNIPSIVTEAASFISMIRWDAVMDFERMQLYKPDLAAYAAICDTARCLPSEVLMVTGNHGDRGIGDDVEPLKIGMQTQKIRRDSPVPDIVALAAMLLRTN